MAASSRQQEWEYRAAFVQAWAKAQVVRSEKRREWHPGPAGFLVLRRVDSPPLRADCDFLNSDPQLMSVLVFRRPSQGWAKLPGRVMLRKLAPAREFQLDLPGLAFSTPNREG
jgi:hypothetical protein